MNVDYLIVGQGISGTWLTWFLEKEGCSFIVIDNNDRYAASKIAAGIINPVTGRRMVATWLIEELLPFAWEHYVEIGHTLDLPVIEQKNLIDFFPTPQMLHAFTKRMEEGAQYLHAFPEQNHFNPYFRYEFGCGEIRPVYMVHTETLLPAWRRYLKNKSLLLEEDFRQGDLKITDTRVDYQDISAKKIIFCDGAQGFENPYFRLLPFAPNKGEVIIVETQGLPDHFIYKKGMLLAPLQIKDTFWVGSSYEWDFADSDPTARFRNSVELLLKSWLKTDFRVLEHKAGVRPATLERRPFVGFHPFHPLIGILNGMGTKGCSLAPYFAKQLVRHLVHGEPIQPDAAIERFHKILSRN